MVKTLYIRTLRIIYFSDLHAARFTLGLAELLWCLTLLWPGDTFERPTYGLMGKMMPEMVWAAVFGVTGLLQWGIMLSGHYHSRFAVCFAAYNSMLWTLVCACMYLSVYPPPAAISGEAALAMAAMWVFARSGYSTDRRSGSFGGDGI